MPRRLLLDGDDLSALLQRVRAEMGPDAVVVKAERVRSGGVAGFFARERFEITVEVPEPRPALRGEITSGPVGLSALLDAADAGDGSGLPDGGSVTGSVTGSAAGAPVPGAAPAPRVSTDGDTFASLLASIDDMADLHPATGQSPPARPTDPRPPSVAPGRAGAPGDAASPAPPAPPASPASPAASATATPEVDGAGSGPAPARIAPRGTAVTRATFAPLADPSGTTQPAGSTSAPTSTPTSTPAPAPATGTAPAADPGQRPTPGAQTLPAGRPAPERRVEAATFPRLPSVPTARAPRVVDTTTPAPAAGSTRAALARLGVPASLLGSVPAEEPLGLSVLIAALPRPPALLRRPGALITVVGEGPSALAVATSLARRVRLDPREVVLAGSIPAVEGHGRRLPTRADAVRHRDEVSAGNTVSIVAVGVDPEEQDAAGGVALLAGLAADQTWAVVDARHKSADVRVWLRSLAGPRPVDVVAVAGAYETQEPGTVLDLGVPVGWIDGIPASPVVWAALLSERLDADVRWD